MSFNVIPREGTDVARFGESRAALRGRLGDCDSFRRTPDAVPTDYFPAVGVLLSFDESDNLNFIELVAPAEVLFKGVSLLERSYRDVISDLEAQDVRGVEDESGTEFSGMCFSLFSPAPEEEDSEVEGVSVFAPGYYG